MSNKVLPKGSAPNMNPGWLLPSKIIHPATPETIESGMLTGFSAIASTVES